MGDLHVEPEGGGAHRLVGRPSSGPTNLPFWFVGFFLSPLVNGTGIGFWCVGFLLVGPLIHVLTRVAS